MGTWRGPDDAAAARFLAEHGMVSGMAGDELVIEAGSEALLPAWPPEDERPGRRVKLPGGPIRSFTAPRSQGVGTSAGPTTPAPHVVVERAIPNETPSGKKSEKPRDFSGEDVPTRGATPDTTVILCAVCQTPVARHGEAGWRHEVSLAERGGCTVAWPAG